MDETVAGFAARKVIARELPFRSGFHSPHFAPYLDLVRHHWARMPLQPAHIPMWSATTCDRYPTDPDEVRQLALDHLVQPVRFRELTERLHEVGVRAFVQVGVGSLIAFADDTLKGREQLTISAASSTSTGLEQLARVGVALWVEGVDVKFDPLLAPLGGAARDTTVDERRGPTVQLSWAPRWCDCPNRPRWALRPDLTGPVPAVVRDGAIAGPPGRVRRPRGRDAGRDQEVGAALARRGPGPRGGPVEPAAGRPPSPPDEWSETRRVDVRRRSPGWWTTASTASPTAGAIWPTASPCSR